MSINCARISNRVSPEQQEWLRKMPYVWNKVVTSDLRWVRSPFKRALEWKFENHWCGRIWFYRNFKTGSSKTIKAKLATSAASPDKASFLVTERLLKQTEEEAHRRKTPNWTERRLNANEERRAVDTTRRKPRARWEFRRHNRRPLAYSRRLLTVT